MTKRVKTLITWMHPDLANQRFYPPDRLLRLYGTLLSRCVNPTPRTLTARATQPSWSSSLAAAPSSLSDVSTISKAFKAKPGVYSKLPCYLVLLSLAHSRALAEQNFHANIFPASATAFPSIRHLPPGSQHHLFHVLCSSHLFLRL